MSTTATGIRIVATLVLAAALAGVMFWCAGILPVGRIGGFQHAARPLAMPASGDIDHRFQMVSAWDQVRIPLALRLDPPMGSEHGALVYNAQKFGEMNEKRGGPHSGDDLNGIGGMNTDLGDPVFSAGDGLVLYAGEPSPGWGNVLVIAHRLEDGRTLHSMYAHLHRIDVSRGALVARGAKIGTVGTSNGYYPAHLHFEMRTSNEVDIGGGYGSNPLNRLDPAATVAAMRNAAPDNPSPSPMAAIKLQQAKQPAGAEARPH